MLERLHGEGFTLEAFPLYERHVGVRKGNCAALLTPVATGTMEIFNEPAFLVGGNFGVRIVRGQKRFFVWKKQELEVTREREEELRRFGEELKKILERAS